MDPSTSQETKLMQMSDKEANETPPVTTPKRALISHQAGQKASQATPSKNVREKLPRKAKKCYHVLLDKLVMDTLDFQKVFVSSENDSNTEDTSEMGGEGDKDPHNATFITRRGKRKNSGQDSRPEHAKEEKSMDKRETSTSLPSSSILEMICGRTTRWMHCTSSRYSRCSISSNLQVLDSMANCPIKMKQPVKTQHILSPFQSSYKF